MITYTIAEKVQYATVVVHTPKCTRYIMTQVNTTVVSARSSHSLTQSYLSLSSWKHRGTKLQTTEPLEEIWSKKLSVCLWV